MNQKIVVLDFGGQYSLLIARRVRDMGVYCELMPYTSSIESIKKQNPIGIIFSGGPSSVYDNNAPTVSPDIFSLKVPILGICYGCQLIAHLLGGKVNRGAREFGKQTLSPIKGKLFEDVTKSVCWMSHNDRVDTLPKGFYISGTTETCSVAAMENPDAKIYGVQFHPEVVHTAQGDKMLKNFLYKVCDARGDWSMDNFNVRTIAALREKIGSKKVLCAMSGGVDSAVAASLIHEASPNLTCIFVDHGLLRKGEAEEVVRVFKEERGMNLIKVDASSRFLSALSGVSDPEQKRKIIGKEFISVFEEESKKLGSVDFLVQGTIYPDVVESGMGAGAAVIKSHHNVGGLPSVVDFKEIIEPLRDLFKDEVRALGLTLGLPEHIVMRQPFPGPGLAIRIIGEITSEKIKILQDADYIFRQEIDLKCKDLNVWQYFAVLLNTKSVGVMGDGRTYDYTLALRAVSSIDGMTADWVKIPHEVLEHMSSRIINEVKEVNRVVYDITSKPPATIEWE